MKTNKLKWTVDSEGTWLCALVNRNEAAVALKNIERDKTYNLEIKKDRGKRRSLDSNAYAWVLMDRLAAHYRISVTDVYKNFIREIGGNSEILCIKSEAVDRFCEGWQKSGIGWQTETMPSKLKGCTNVKIYYGSSTYDTEQMSRLIELIVSECKEAGIETATPDEIKRLLSLWREKQHDDSQVYG